MDFTDSILAESNGDKVLAGFRLAERLMEGDAASFKAGYSDEAAAYGAQTAFGLTDEERELVARAVRPTPEEPKPGDIDFANGLHDFEWYVYRWTTDPRINADGCWDPIGAGPFADKLEAVQWYASHQEHLNL